MARAKAQGHRVGRPPREADFMSVVHLSIREAASHLGVSRSVVHRWRLSQKGTENEPSTASTIQ
jgi:transposase